MPLGHRVQQLHERGVVHVQVLLLELAAGGRFLELLRQQVGHLPNEMLVRIFITSHHAADELKEPDRPRVLQLVDLVVHEGGDLIRVGSRNQDPGVPFRFDQHLRRPDGARQRSRRPNDDGPHHRPFEADGENP